MTHEKLTKLAQQFRRQGEPAARMTCRAVKAYVLAEGYLTLSAKLEAAAVRANQHLAQRDRWVENFDALQVHIAALAEERDRLKVERDAELAELAETGCNCPCCYAFSQRIYGVLKPAPSRGEVKE